MSDAVMISLISAVTSSLAALLGFLGLLLSRQNSQNIEQTKQTIVTLEKNTNSIKDALVKVTGEAEFAKGLEVGSKAAKADNSVVQSGASTLIAEVQLKAARSEGMIQGMAEERARIEAEKIAKLKPKDKGDA